MTDYALSKLFFDLQQAALRAEYLKDRRAMLKRYGITEEVAQAVLADDVAALAPRVNPYLLRYYFSYVGMPDQEFIRRMQAGAAKEDRP